MIGLDALKPYMMLLKIGGLALAVALLVGGGCHWQAKRDATKIEKMQTKLDNAAASLRAAGSAIRAVNIEADRSIKAARSAAAANAKAAEAARRDAAESERRMLAIDREVETAKRRDPNCRKQLELPTCATLH